MTAMLDVYNPGDSALHIDGVRVNARDHAVVEDSELLRNLEATGAVVVHDSDSDDPKVVKRIEKAEKVRAREEERVAAARAQEESDRKAEEQLNREAAKASAKAAAEAQKQSNDTGGLVK